MKLSNCRSASESVHMCMHAWTCPPYSGFTSLLHTNSRLPPLTDMLFCFRKTKYRQWFFYFEALHWYFFFPSSKSVICFLAEHSSAFLFHACLISSPGCNEKWAPTAGFALSTRAREIAAVGTHCPCCSGAIGSPVSFLLTKFFLISPVQPSISSRGWSLSVSAHHLGTSMCEDGVLKCWRSAVLHQHLLVG